MRRVRTVLLVLAVVAFAIAIATGAALWFAGGPALAWLIENPVSWMSGRPITIDGPVTIVWDRHWSQPIIDDIHVGNASWGTAPEMFVAKRIEIDVAPLSLIFRPIRIALVEIDDAELVLETSTSGARNWQLAIARNAVPSHRRHFPDVAKFIVRHSVFTWHNGESGARDVLRIEQMVAAEPDPNAAVTLAGLGTFQGHRLRLKGTVGPLAQMRNAAMPYPVSLRGEYDQTAVALDGTMTKPLDFAGLDLRMSLAGHRLENVADALGVPLPALPNFRGTAVLVGGNGRYTLSKLSLQLGESDLEGGIGIDATGKIIYLRANLTSRRLDLANFKGAYGGNPAGAAPKHPTVSANGKVVPNTHIEIGRLPGLNADLTFYGTDIANIAGTRLQRVTLALHLKDGQLALEPLKFHVAEGDVDLNAIYTPMSRGPPRLHGKISLRHVDLHKLLQSQTYPEMVRNTAGIAGGELQIDSTGLSPRELLAHMNGDLAVFVQNGQVSDLMQQLANLNILKLLGVYLTGDEPVPINCAVMHFNVVHGLAAVSTFLIDTDETQITGRGTVDFAGETLDLTLTPANKHFTALTLSSPIRITGPFAKPDFSIESRFAHSRLGKAETLAIVPPAALVVMIDTGLGENNACTHVLGGQRQPQQSQAPAR